MFFSKKVTRGRKISIKKRWVRKKKYCQVRRFDEGHLSQYWRIFRAAMIKAHIKLLKSFTCVVRGVAAKINKI